MGVKSLEELENIFLNIPISYGVWYIFLLLK
jgi:hypothetical protein